MQLGAFSVSLSVKNIALSLAFYQRLGFTTFAGDQEQGWLMLRNGDCVIGLFQGMFDKNTLTFNPGWDMNCQTLESFTDVRDIQKQLKAHGDVEFTMEAEESGSGPGFLALVDPDGNPVLIDQHV